MTKKRKLGLEVVVFLIGYCFLISLIIIERNLLDIGYFFVLTFYSIRLYLCRKKNKTSKQ